MRSAYRVPRTPPWHEQTDWYRLLHQSRVWITQDGRHLRVAWIQPEHARAILAKLEGEADRIMDAADFAEESIWGPLYDRDRLSRLWPPLARIRLTPMFRALARRCRSPKPDPGIVDLFHQIAAGIDRSRNLL